MLFRAGLRPNSECPRCSQSEAEWDFLLNQAGHPHSHSHGGPTNPPSTGHSHGHGHSHGSLAVRAAFVHALGDLAQSVGVLIAAYIIRFKVTLASGNKVTSDVV
ncbi:unnamed protein product [Ranitomeya imitator]|uniref:Cation efflux protein transmembrane domain-containing protein n=1 Tax=Ranitomeya imitator TaxID=111125 RepID=A0ABN9MM33_9NEOB|nr:unnamed protein product [Ranitomeya imitator]